MKFIKFGGRTVNPSKLIVVGMMQQEKDQDNDTLYYVKLWFDGKQEPIKFFNTDKNRIEQENAKFLEDLEEFNSTVKSDEEVKV